MKLSQDCFSEWGTVAAGVPQGTNLGPWLSLIMLNNLYVANTNVWKSVDDTTISEKVWKHKTTKLHSCVDELIFSWMNLDVKNCVLPLLDPSGHFHPLSLTVSQ